MPQVQRVFVVPAAVPEQPASQAAPEPQALPGKQAPQVVQDIQEPLEFGEPPGLRASRAAQAFTVLLELQAVLE